MKKLLICIACVVVILAFLAPALVEAGKIKDYINGGGSASESSTGTNPLDPSEPLPATQHTVVNHVCQVCGLDDRFKLSDVNSDNYADKTYYINVSTDFGSYVATLKQAQNLGYFNSNSVTVKQEEIDVYCIKSNETGADSLLFRFTDDGVYMTVSYNGGGGTYDLWFYQYADGNVYAANSASIDTVLGYGYTLRGGSDAVIYNRTYWSQVFTENYNPEGYTDFATTSCVQK